MDNTVTIRSLRKEDLDEVATLERASFSQPWSREQFGEDIDKSFAVMLCAEKDGQVAGYLDAHCVGEDAHINNIAVAPGERRCGTGRRLIETLVERVRGMGAAQITLEVREKDTGAVMFYENAGFETIGRRRRFYILPEDDALVMIKYL